MGATVTAQNSRKPRSREGINPDINVTPLVDVVLVLLIIFMVIAPEMEHGERVELPALIHTDDPRLKPKDPVTVSIGAAGSFFIEKEPIADIATLAARLKAEHEKAPERKLILKADSTLPYEKVRTLLASLQENGLTGVSLSVTQKGKAPEPEGN
ncbi:MAG: biopolymer transporter ExbD [Polyangiaceae bacterium]|nr:biopolymer transporter ExbD [Polyangiaceae bacterium]